MLLVSILILLWLLFILVIMGIFIVLEILWRLLLGKMLMVKLLINFVFWFVVCMILIFCFFVNNI